jgi:hypothetical protein
VEMAAPQAALEPPTGAGSGGADVVVVLDKDSAPPPTAGDRDVVMTSMTEPTPAARAPKPSPAAEVLEPSPVAGEAKTSSVVGAVTVEEVMELETSWYIDFPGVGIVDLDAPSSRARCWKWRRSGCSPSR